MSDEMVSIEERNRRRKARIARIKRLIVGSVIVAIVFPTILSLCLMFRVSSLQKQVNELNKLLETKNETSEEDKELDLADGVYATELPAELVSQPTEETQVQTPTETEDANTVPKQTVAYLTFDDGPSENTGAILDILNEYNVKATFFVVGKETDEAKALYKRIVDEGHTIGMHSYSHQYSEIYS